MTQQALALVGATAHAGGHPTDCQETVSGTVEATGSCSVTINGTAVATANTVRVHFDAHAHAFEDADGDGTNECTDVQPHDVFLDSTMSVTVNGASVFTVDEPVGTDPGSGGAIRLIESGGNNSISESQ